jgi:hypothetical protein
MIHFASEVVGDIVASVSVKDESFEFVFVYLIPDFFTRPLRLPVVLRRLDCKIKCLEDFLVFLLGIRQRRDFRSFLF